MKQVIKYRAALRGRHKVPVCGVCGKPIRPGKRSAHANCGAPAGAVALRPRWRGKPEEGGAA